MKNVLVTGGSRGIGKDIVIQLARDGYNVLLNYNTSEKNAIEIKEMLKKEGYNIEIFKADVSKKEEVKKLFEFYFKKFKNINVLINNAGISEIKQFIDITYEDWDNMINSNLNSVFYTTKEAMQNMIYNKSGCIINISSIWGMVGASCEVHYSAAKAGMIGFTKALAKEMAPSNIRVNTIAPGDIDTDMNSNFTEKELEMIKEEIPLRKIGKPQDITKCVKWLIDDEYTTGQVISPNGGWVI